MAFNARGIVQNEIYQKLMFDKLEIMRTYVNTFSNVPTKVFTYSHLQSLTQGFGLCPIVVLNRMLKYLSVVIIRKRVKEIAKSDYSVTLSISIMCPICGRGFCNGQPLLSDQEEILALVRMSSISQ